MSDQPVPFLDDLRARLDRERQDADRRYNDALTAVDHALQSTPRLPDAPPAYDGARLDAINRNWDILPAGAPPADRSLKGRLRAFIWRLVGPPLETQKHFNAALVDHVNRNAGAGEQVPRTLAALLDAVATEFAALVRFESLLVQYLQTITLYVDTKDRSLAGVELRQRLALTEQRLLTLKHELEQRGHEGPSAGGGPGKPVSPGNEAVFAGAVDSATYVGFEDRFRGPQDEIARRVEEYLPILSAASNVLDVGCGRGELLRLLRDHGVSAHGIDSSAAMVAVCRSDGLAAEQGDALAYLEQQSTDSVGGLVAIQVVEHFAPAYLVRFLETAYHRMRPGAPLVLETINPACWMAFFETYIRDLTHQRPLHPDTLGYLVQAAGFSGVDIRYRRPVADADRLDHVAPGPPGSGGPGGPGDHDLTRVVAALNANADKLNARLFSSMDYVVIARR